MLGLLALTLAAAFAGAAVYVFFAEQPARLALDDRAAMAQWQPSYARGAVMQGGLGRLHSSRAGLGAAASAAYLWPLA